MFEKINTELGALIPQYNTRLNRYFVQKPMPMKRVMSSVDDIYDVNENIRINIKVTDTNIADLTIKGSWDKAELRLHGMLMETIYHDVTDCFSITQYYLHLTDVNELVLDISGTCRVSVQYNFVYVVNEPSVRSDFNYFSIKRDTFTASNSNNSSISFVEPADCACYMATKDIYLKLDKPINYAYLVVRVIKTYHAELNRSQSEHDIVCSLLSPNDFMIPFEKIDDTLYRIIIPAKDVFNPAYTNIGFHISSPHDTINGKVYYKHYNIAMYAKTEFGSLYGPQFI